MQVIKLTYPVTKDIEPNVCGVGYFDGVHLGHQKLINEVIENAKSFKVKSAIFTFSKSIDLVLGHDFYGEITPLDERIAIFDDLGIDICFVFEFNKAMSELSPVDFMDKVLKPLNSKMIVCGNDFHFGHKGLGNYELLKTEFNVNVIDFLNVQNQDYKISSRNIINYIKEANLVEISLLLGRNYAITGKVIKGLGNGKKIGFPTANIDYSGYVLPRYGVYQVTCELDGKLLKGLANIGTHPTLDELKTPTLEVFLSDFDQNIYDKTLKVWFVKYIRDEVKFSDVENLKKHIKLDTFFNF